MALPRRSWESDPELPALVELLTAHCRVAGGTRVLRPGQAVALKELFDYSTALCASEIGSGKTDIAFLAAALLKSKRPLFLAPAKLLGKYDDSLRMLAPGKTEREFSKLRHEWISNPNWTFLSYEKLSRDKYSDFLERLQPDLIVAEEAHRLKNPKRGRTKRVRRWMEAHPSTVFIPLTGSLKRKSLLECSHLSEWALKDNTPIPRYHSRYWGELDEWRRALDTDTRDQDKMAMGVLQQFAPNGDLQAVRDAYTTFRQQTPGWVTVTGSGIDTSLSLIGVKVDSYPAKVDALVDSLRTDNSTPDGEFFIEPAQLSAAVQQCSLNFMYRLQPPPPKEWRECRRAWGMFVRDILSHNRRNLDTEMQVALACARGEILDYGLHRKWKEIRPTYKVDEHRVTEWFDDSFLNWCIKWLEKEQGVLFTHYIAFGEKMKELTGLPYFHHSGIDREFGSIDTYKGGPCIASMNSVLEGFNLQDRWNKGCLVGGTSNSTALHQLIGRFHRPGQVEDEVEFTFPYGCIESLEILHRARGEAEAGDNKAHKLLLGDFVVDSLEDAEAWTGPRWQKSS